MKNPAVRVRFAPSPTGHLHLGSARTALFNLLFARAYKGTYVIRIEDTDLQRSTSAFLTSQMQSLEWLGLTSDEPLVFQSQFKKDHEAMACRLLAEGHAYACFCPPSERSHNPDLELEETKQAHRCNCRITTWSPKDLQQPHAIRFRVPDNEGEVIFHDEIRGEIRVATQQIEDFVILRQDGYPTYNFCVVIDDITMRISHVIRGEDHISNTPKQVLLYRALQAPLPYFAHIPLILGPSGNKLSKRDGSVSIEEYREQGFLPQALCNYLARLGWSHGDQEVFEMSELTYLFSLDHIGKKGAIFDIQKLRWLNGIYLRGLSSEQLLFALEQMQQGSAQQIKEVWKDAYKKVLTLYQERSETLQELYNAVIACAYAPEVYDEEALKKHWVPHSYELLQAFCSHLERDEVFIDKSLLQEYATTLVKQQSLKLPTLTQSLRIALTGNGAGPGVFALIEVLGRKESVKRLNLFLEKVRSLRDSYFVA